MDIEDFTTFFSKVELCNLSVADFFYFQNLTKKNSKIFKKFQKFVFKTTKISEDDNAEMNWVSEIKEKRWLRGLTAGGCTNFKVIQNGSEVPVQPTYGTIGTPYILSFRIRSGKIPNFLSVWMKSMTIQMWKAKDVLSLLHFFKKIQTEDETNTNY